MLSVDPESVGLVTRLLRDLGKSKWTKIAFFSMLGMCGFLGWAYIQNLGDRAQTFPSQARAIPHVDLGGFSSSNLEFAECLSYRPTSAAVLCLESRILAYRTLHRDEFTRGLSGVPDSESKEKPKQDAAIRTLDSNKPLADCSLDRRCSSIPKNPTAPTNKNASIEATALDGNKNTSTERPSSVN